MTDAELDARWERRLAARKALVNAADDLFVFLCEIEGGDAMIECTAERAEVFRYVYDLPRYNAAARRRIMQETC